MLGLGMGSAPFRVDAWLSGTREDGRKGRSTETRVSVGKLAAHAIAELECCEWVNQQEEMNRVRPSRTNTELYMHEAPAP
jgi:hypothetical protein